MVWKLVRESGVLDLNSPYCYLILCKDFPETCVIAEQDLEVVGFVTAYRPPTTPHVVFVWQIGVSETARGQGLGTAMLLSLLERKSCRNISHLEATVTPSNERSLRLFHSLARRLHTRIAEEACFGEELFPDGGHQAERLIRIGPINKLNHTNGEHSENDRTP